ncbi:hypothetical protein EV176_007605, partial [Coemansia sp. RSA 451]
MWIRDFLEQLHVDVGRIKISCDNQAAVLFARSGCITEDNKHYRVKLRLTYNKFKEGLYNTKHIAAA